MIDEAERTRPMKIIHRGLIAVIAAVILAAVCFRSGFLMGGKQTEEMPELDAVVIQNHIEQISELASAKYYYTNMARFEDAIEVNGVTIPFTSKRFIVSYDGTILAGIELSDVEVSVTETQVTVTLPEAKIMSHEIQEESLQVYDETKNIFNPIKIEDYNQFQMEQKEIMEAKAIENGLLIQAQERAALVIGELLMPFVEQYGLELIIR